MIKIVVSLVLILIGANAYSMERIYKMAGFWELNTKEVGEVEERLISSSDNERMAFIQSKMSQHGDAWKHVALFHFSEGKPGYSQVVESLLEAGADPTYKFYVSEIGEISSPIKVAFNSIKLQKHNEEYAERYSEALTIYEILSESVQESRNLSPIEVVLQHIEPYLCICD